ncbi:MAG: hypothetical protein HY712_00680 [candidate division NC10 bacterium]|nr:hypothetical protein [candidate division NC10 bacterium]
MQLKLFERRLAERDALEAEINAWLAVNPKLVAIQRDFSVYANHTTREDHLLVLLWHEPKSAF